jgi:hypothetical protein
MAQLDRATVCGTVGRRFESSWAHHISGEVAERSKAVDSKSAVPYGYRGFESHPLLSPYEEGKLVDGYLRMAVIEHNSQFLSLLRALPGVTLDLTPLAGRGSWLTDTV